MRWGAATVPRRSPRDALRSIVLWAILPIGIHDRLVFMTRPALVFLFASALAACKHEAPAPPRVSASATVSPSPVDAGQTAESTTNAAREASVDAAPPTLNANDAIRADGVGPLSVTTDASKVSALLLAAFPGAKTETKHSEGEDNAFDTTSLTIGGTRALDVVVDDMRDRKRVFRIDVFGAMFATRDSIHVGSTVAELAAQDAAVTCQRRSYASNPEGFDHALFCDSPKLANVTFYLDHVKVPGADGAVPPAKLAGAKIVRILWRNPTVH